MGEKYDMIFSSSQAGLNNDEHKKEGSKERTKG
jgi:hypothetical protein